MTENPRTPPPKPPHPYAVLAAAAVLPASGHVWLGQVQRGLTFLFFMLVLGALTVQLAPPQATFVGRHAGGVFVYALSLIDAYKLARVRWQAWREAQGV